MISVGCLIILHDLASNAGRQRTLNEILRRLDFQPRERVSPNS